MTKFYGRARRDLGRDDRPKRVQHEPLEADVRCGVASLNYNADTAERLLKRAGETVSA
jgi:hypothetical protein